MAVNLSKQPITVALDGGPTQILLASGEATTAPDNVRLSGESFAVVAL